MIELIWEFTTDGGDTWGTAPHAGQVPPGALCRLRPPTGVEFFRMAATPKNPPYWVSHTRRLFYRDRVVADLRFSAATPDRVEFMVKALNDAEEKR